MGYVDIQNLTVEVTLDEVWRDADTSERGTFAQEHGGEIIDLLGGQVEVNIEDPVKRLEVIVALRKMGYTVEGGGPA